MSNFNQQFARETWSLFAVGLLIICIRLGARIRKLGITKLQIDDYLMLNAAVWYTILVISINSVIFGGGSNLMTAEEKAALTPESIRNRIRGSKWVFVSEHAMVITLWSLKLCMLSIYSRLTEGLKQRKFFKMIFIWVIFGFIASESGLFIACRPLDQYWAISPSNVQCASYQHYEIAEAIFNMSSDIMMLLIAMPLLLSVQLPLQQKAVLLVIFGMGTFVVVAAILTKIYCLVPSLISYVYLNWYFREASVSVYVTNLPALWSLLRDIFRPLRSWGFESKKSTGSGGHWPSSATHTRHRMSSKTFPLQSFSRLGSNSGNLQHSSSQSQERINHIDDFVSNPTLHAQPLEITRDVTFTVEKEPADKDLESGNPDRFPSERVQTRCTAARHEPFS